MQTFLPYTNYIDSLACLDYKRLGKQRVEAMQIMKAIENGGGWKNHPIVKMWRDYLPALEIYKNTAIKLWINRGFKNTMPITTKYLDKLTMDNYYPIWLTDEFCDSHKSNLLRKDKDFYSKYNWNVPDNLPYKWEV